MRSEECPGCGVDESRPCMCRVNEAEEEAERARLDAIDPETLVCGCRPQGAPIRPTQRAVPLRPAPEAETCPYCAEEYFGQHYCPKTGGYR